jgi:hypothetical protein
VRSHLTLIEQDAEREMPRRETSFKASAGHVEILWRSRPFEFACRQALLYALGARQLRV